MRIQPIQPISRIHTRQPPIDLAEYKRIKTDVETYQPDAEAWFGRVDRLMVKVFSWFMVLAATYLAAQISRALANGWLP